MRHFCTYFDRHYLLHGLALYRSLRRHAAPMRLHALCFDPESHAVLSGMGRDDLSPIALEEFERGDAQLAAAKSDRSRVEYYFTCTPSLPLYVLERSAGIDCVTYVDADLCFFSSPQPIHDEMGAGSVLIIGHRFGEGYRENAARFGTYNVGYLVFRNDETGRACLKDWRERCLEWCRDVVEPGRFADQKYLDAWPERFPGVVVSAHKGANLARWNCMNYELRLRDESVTVDGQPLIFYHFNGFRIVNRCLYDPDFDDYRIRQTLPPNVLDFLYGTYIAEIKEGWERVGELAPGLSFGLANPRTGPGGWTRALGRLLRGRLIFAP